MRNIFAAFAFAMCTVVFAAAASAAETPAPQPSVSHSQSSASVATLNLNTADAETLQRELSGVGAVKAQAIVSYREQNGNFESVEELLEVKGIGEALLEKNREKISVN